MGAGSSGVFFSTQWDMWTKPETNPSVKDKPKNDPLHGFAQEREKRVQQVSEEDMYWAKIKPNRRDYCAQHLMDLQRCRRDNFPFVGKCEHYRHDWDNCQNEDTVYRMKEYERERRLLQREQRKKQKEESLNHA